MCLLADAVPVGLLTAICIAHHDVAKCLFMVYAFVTTIAYILTFLLNFLVFRIVARHIHIVQCLLDRTRLLETKQVALSTLAQALVPLVCQVSHIKHIFFFIQSTLYITRIEGPDKILVIATLYRKARIRRV